jgi:hyperosmotically inducible protein
MKPKLIVVAPAVIVASLSLRLPAEPNNNPAAPVPAHGNSVTRSGQSENAAPLNMLVRGKDIVGLEVRNDQDEKLGKIDDLIVDVGAQRITGLLVGVGGVLGVGEKPVVVPLSAFHYDAERKVMLLNSTKDSLKGAPRFEVGTWQEFRNQPEVGEVYRYFGTTPYFTGNPGAAPAADPTARPRVDRSGTALTPTDQGNNSRDLQITSQIRKDVLAQSGLSVGARNAKIITLNGRVTLRGAVASDSERELLQRIAETAAPNQVDNQLVVTPGTARN